MIFPTGSRRNIWQAALLIAVFAGLFALYVILEKQIDQANEIRQQSLALSDELRHSSDDLTRMVRSYVATSEEHYKLHYLEILGIRNGSRPRPLRYNDVYWDVVQADDRRPSPYGEAIALMELLRQAGFTKSEFATLAAAKEYSDKLTQTEIVAMDLAERQPARRGEALQMLFDADYHAAKAKIMGSIRAFELMMDQRTLDAVLLAEQKAALVRLIFVAVAISLLSLQYRQFRRERTLLGGSPDDVHRYIAHLGNGDFSIHIPVAAGQEGSVMGRLAATQQRLRQASEEHARLEDELRKLAYYDLLTGAANRRRGEEVLTQEVHRSLRYGVPLTIALLDVDHFKRINDQFGHAEGDAVLRLLCSTLQEHLRASDLLVRWGGEEFLLILPQTHLAGGLAAVDAVRALVAELSCSCGRFTVSVGLAQLAESEDVSRVVQRADAMLYQAKHQGRNRCVADGAVSAPSSAK